MRNLIFLHDLVVFAIAVCATPTTAHSLSNRDNAPPPAPSPGGDEFFAVIGDSFSSGIGAGRPYNHSNDTCSRRTGAYPVQLEGLSYFHWNPEYHDGEPTFDFEACPGSLTSNVQASGQIEAITSNTGLVLVSIGQNDVGYTPALSSCLLFGSDCSDALSNFNTSLFGDTTFFESYNQFMNDTVDALQWSLRQSHTLIYQTSYSQLFEDMTTTCNSDSFLSPLLTTSLRQQINTMTQQLNFVISYWIDNINYQHNHSPAAADPIRFADQDERYTSHRFCQQGVSEPAYENKHIWYFHLGDRDEQQATKLPEFVSAKAYAHVDTTTCSVIGSTDAELGAAINCGLAKEIAGGIESPFPRGLWPQISDGNGGNSTAKTFHPTINGHGATAAEINQRLHYRLPSAGGEPSHKNLQIVAVGDSITWGYTSSEGSGYRKFLYEILAANPSNQVNFVGSQLTGTSGSPWEQNEGYPGLKAGQILETFDVTEVKRANVILLMAGTNDVNLATSDDLSANLADLNNLMTTLVATNPEAVLIVAHITPIGLNEYSWPPSVAQQRVINWNAQINMMVNRIRLSGAKILKAHTTVTTFEHNDDLHPNDNGYEKLAYDFAERLSDAQDFGWLMPRREEVPTNLKQCNTSPIWIPNGEIASGGGLGPDSYPSIICVDDLQDSTQCNCSFSDGSGSYLTPLVGNDCPSNGYDLIHAVHFADLDGDGRAEYLWVDEIGAVTAFYNRGPPAGSNDSDAAQVIWESAGVIATGIGGKRQEIHFADLNGDGRAEYLWVQPNGAVECYLNGGQIPGSDTPANINWIGQGIIATGIGTPGSSITFADLNGDGRAEYLSVGSDGSVIAYWNAEFMANLASGAAFVNWIPQGEIASGVGGVRNETVFADVNGLGRASYLEVSRGVCATVEEYKNLGGGNGEFVNWMGGVNISLADGCGGVEGRVTFADLTGDGRAEYLVVDPNTSAVTAYFNGCA